MPNGFLLSRVLLKLGKSKKDFREEISAAAMDTEGNIWVGSDDLLTIDRLAPQEECVYSDRTTYHAGDFIELYNDKDEIDIEGMDFNNNYLWLTGSHSTKRKKPKGKSRKDDLERIANVSVDQNRYLLARFPVFGGEIFRECTHPDQPELTYRASSLEKKNGKNSLIEALKKDEHLGPFLSFPLPSKENGFDIEGLAVDGNRVFLGFRGPVLRGWTVIVEIEVVEKKQGTLELKKIGKNGRYYKKHFVHLNGLGVRELCKYGKDILILAGPTLDMEGAMRLFRLKGGMELENDSIHGQDSRQLKVMFDLPVRVGCDRAEGLTLFPCLGYKDALMVVYDSPAPERITKPGSILMDVYRLQ